MSSVKVFLLIVLFTTSWTFSEAFPTEQKIQYLIDEKSFFLYTAAMYYLEFFFRLKKKKEVDLCGPFDL